MMMEDYSKYKVKGIQCPICYVEGGTMQIGEGDNQHSVTIPSFFMGQFQITQALYEVVMETNPSYFKGATRPVERVSWNDTHKFLKKLNKETGKEFRLPSESEWEYAARGGVYSQGLEYCGSDDLRQVGWYRDNSGGETKPVGLLLPNELGLYDMSGNVYEWCEDDYYSDFKNAPKDGNAWRGDLKRKGGILNSIGDFFKDKPIKRAVRRVLRGGYCFGGAVRCRPALRRNGSPGISNSSVGFRVVLAPVQ